MLRTGQAGAHCRQHQELAPPLCARARPVPQNLLMRWTLVQCFVTAWIGRRQQLLRLLRWSLTYSVAGQVQHPDISMQPKHWCLCRLTGGQCLQQAGRHFICVPRGPPHEHAKDTCHHGVQHSMLLGETVAAWVCDQRPMQCSMDNASGAHTRRA